MNDQPTPEQVVRNFIAWENGDESMRDVSAESLDMYNPGLDDGEVHTRAAWAEYLEKSRQGFPDVRFEIEELVADGNVVMVEVTVTGTHEGEFKGVPPTGRSVEFGGMSTYVVEAGRVVECRTYYDTAALAEQLGLTFPAIIRQFPALAWRKVRP